VKGAPESLVEVCTSTAGDGDGSSFTDHDKTRWLETNEELAKEGLRVLALAKKEVSSTDANPYRDLTFLGLIAFVDPPRRDVKEAIATTRRAGVRVVMVTGDQRATAAYIARELGIISENSGSDENVLIGKELDGRDLWSEQDRERRLKASVFARVSPEQKLSLISLHQDNGDIVAMTGDGVNDAPALKKANIGVAMGRRGTQVARETADMILKDDRFSTIVSALRHGRIIFNNVRKFVLYLLSGNVAEILAVGAASLANAPLPLLPLQILFLNFVLDVFPALALGVGEGDPRVMKQPPRDPSESVLTTYHWVFIGSFGFLIALCVLGALFTSLTIFHMPANRAVTISFLTAAFGRLWHVFNMRESGSAVLHNEVTENKWLWTAVLLCVSLLLAAVYIPGLSSALSVSDPGIRGWALIIVFSIIPLIGGQFYRSLSGREMS
jgi:Ca2+-transporting ATPase